MENKPYKMLLEQRNNLVKEYMFYRTKPKAYQRGLDLLDTLIMGQQTNQDMMNINNMDTAELQKLREDIISKFEDILPPPLHYLQNFHDITMEIRDRINGYAEFHVIHKTDQKTIKRFKNTDLETVTNLISMFKDNNLKNYSVFIRIL